MLRHTRITRQFTSNSNLCALLKVAVKIDTYRNNGDSEVPAVQVG